MARRSTYGGSRIAGSGTEGVTRLAEQRCELVVVEAELPGTDALAQGRRLVTHRPPVLLLTARDAHALLRERGDTDDVLDGRSGGRLSPVR
ncbi:hypothetical protein N7U49_43905 [Streptomyces sp. AD2-2]|nr:hypothetical protein N7U49_43905 [Streptomyces sp. AD2-2]